ncbi:MAG: hypothetical protein ACRCTW_01010 [Lactococcus garvieae]
MSFRNRFVKFVRTFLEDDSMNQLDLQDFLSTLSDDDMVQFW